VTHSTGLSSRELIEQAERDVARLRAQQAENDRLISGIRGAQSELRELTAQAVSPDGTVTVVAGAGGIVQSVQLSDRAMSGNAKTLAASINAAVQDAISAASSKQLDVLRAHVGDAVPAEQLLGPQARFADGADSATSSPAPSPAAAYDDYDEDEEYDPFRSPLR
jgi:DNA-binding protein YbaB